MLRMLAPSETGLPGAVGVGNRAMPSPAFPRARSVVVRQNSKRHASASLERCNCEWGSLSIRVEAVGTVKKSIAAIASRWFRRKAGQRRAGSGLRVARFTQRETVRSEMPKPSLSSSPWMRGAPHVGFSATIRKISSRTSLLIGFLPTAFRAREIQPQYSRKPARYQRTTVSGETRINDLFQPDQAL